MIGLFATLLGARAFAGVDWLVVVAQPDARHAGSGAVVLAYQGDGAIDIAGFDLVGPVRWAGAPPAGVTLRANGKVSVDLVWTEPGPVPVELIVRTKLGNLVVRPEKAMGKQPAPAVAAPVAAPAGDVPQAAGVVAPEPAVTGVAVVVGGMEEVAVHEEVNRHKPELAACYAPDLAADPLLAGIVTTRFSIGADGAVTSAAIKATTFPDGSVEACVASTFARMNFPAPKGGGNVVVTYPLAFNPG